MMGAPSTLLLPFLLSGLLSTASAQFGGGFAPPQTPPTPQTPQTTPPTAVPPPASQEPAAQPPTNPQTEPTEEEIRKYEEANKSPEQVAPPASDAPPAEVAPPAAKNEQQGTRITCEAPENSWSARIDKADQAALDARLGYALPKMPDNLKWVGADAATASPNCDGKVVVIQSIDVGNTAPNVLDRIITELGASFVDGDVVVIGVQTPNKLVAAMKRLAKSKSKASLCADEEGSWCDALGIYKKPANLVVDRNGAVRYVGLNEKGTAAAVKLLLAEPKVAIPVAARPEVEQSATAPTGVVAFPTFTDPVTNATDLRGKQSPELLVDQWMTAKPNTKSKVVIVDFFFTGCPPCRAAVPHMNEIVAHYGDAIAVIGVSWESKSVFDSGLQKYKLKEKDFHYALGLDTTRRTISAFGVKSYPCIAIISGDGVVRWQGHPNSLTDAVLDPIVAANKQLMAKNGKSGSTGRGQSARGWSSN